ncbi:hypothetical protein AQUCO_09100072v1 [Aquilegia coerulea]|uniref:Uncharacterized protein n=1 Tax=Aquilegia coerulea TaxID=218851 RepID=A0A2G5C5T7_AQUCA|nr:hypothetical protein AQUCO_09100072v1 [Aquilegia coerulea]
MGSRIPASSSSHQQQYNLRSANFGITSLHHNLNNNAATTIDPHPRTTRDIHHHHHHHHQEQEEEEEDGDDDEDNDISNVVVNHDAVTQDSLEEDQAHHHSNSVDCIYRNSLQLHNVGLDEDHASLENNGCSSAPYHILTLDDILPIETARARFLQIVVDHFINEHTIEVTADSEVDYAAQSCQDKLHKRTSTQVQYEGDPRYALPLMYVANLYETLVNDVNIRLAPFGGIREKTIGVALEAAGGLYRKLAKKFPKKGTCSFRRRELATSLETRTRFPELVVQDQKRVRFVVVNGLVIVEKPTSVPVEDADWFKRLTGRHEMAVSGRDYKFYSPRHKYRRVGSQSVSNMHDLSPQNQQQSASKHHIQPIQHQPQFHSLRQSHQQPLHQSHHVAHFPHSHQFVPSPQLPEIPQALQSMSQHATCLQPLTGGQVGGRLHILPTTPAKFCDGCGAPYLRETSKFCSECGVKRLGT